MSARRKPPVPRVLPAALVPHDRITEALARTAVDRAREDALRAAARVRRASRSRGRR